MKKVKEKAHAKFSPSASSRWLACPGSIYLSSLVPVSPETPQAAEGTKAHIALEMFLKNGHEKMLSTNRFLREQGYPAQMVMDVERAAQWIWKETPKGAILLAETKSECFHIDKEMHGTADAVVMQDFGELHVIDFKYGKMPVSAGNNAQLMAYAVGLAHKFQYNFDTVKLTILQPRSANQVFQDSWVTTIEHLLWWEKKFKDGVKAAKRKEPDFLAGTHCFFCPGKPVCLEYTPEVSKSMRSLFIQAPSASQKLQQVALDFDDESASTEKTKQDLPMKATGKRRTRKRAAF